MQQASVPKDLLARSWRRCTGALVPRTITGSVFDQLLARYSEPHRKYHTLQHLAECLAHVEAVRHLAEQPGEVEFALWFHDGLEPVHGLNGAALGCNRDEWADRACRMG